MSACALAWLGGQKRFAPEGSVIGFHAAYTEGARGTETTGTGNALVGAYMSELGFSTEAIIFATSQNANSLAILTPATARRLGVSIEPFGEGGSAERPVEPRPQQRIGVKQETFDRAARIYYSEIRGKHPSEVDAAIRACHKRAGELRTLDAVAYCFAFESLVSGEVYFAFERTAPFCAVAALQFLGQSSGTRGFTFSKPRPRSRTGQVLDR